MRDVCPGRASVILALVFSFAFFVAGASGQQVAEPVEGEAPTVQLNLPENTELKLLIEYVTQRLKLNVIYEDRLVQKRVTIKSPTPIPVDALRPLLENVLRTQGLLLIEAPQRGFLQIVEMKDLPRLVADGGARQAQAELRVFRLEHAQPREAEPLIKPLLTQPGGSLQAIPDRGLLLVSDLRSQMDTIEEMIALIDQAPETVTSRFIDVKHRDAAQLANDVSQYLTAMQAGQARGGSSASAMVRADSQSNRLIMIGSRDQIIQAAELVDQLDVDAQLRTEVYPVRAVDPARIDRMVKEMIGPKKSDWSYRSFSDAASGLLVVTTTEDHHELVKLFIEQMDDAGQGGAKSPIRFYKLANAKAIDVLETVRAIEGGGSLSRFEMDGVSSPDGATSNNPGAGGRKAGDLFSDDPQPGSVNSVTTERATVTADVTTNTIIVAADAATHAIYEGLIKRLDVRRPQVLVEITVVTLDTSDQFALGIEIGADGEFSGGGGGRTIGFSSFGVGDIDTGTGSITLSPTPGVGFNGAILVPEIADIVVTALESESRARVLSSPKILVNDNATGTLSSVAEQPVTSINAGETVSTTTFNGFVSAGTDIEVSPQIAEGDHLKLDFNVALNAFTGEGSGGIPAPRQTNSIASEVTIPDGHTIVVGGLTLANTSDAETRVPLLGSIPGLGNLFKSQSDSGSESTLFVFIRPVILRDDLFRDLKYLSQQDLERAGLPDDYPASAPVVMR